MNTKENNKFVRRLIMCVVGIALCGFSIALFKLSNLGVDPFQSFAQGSHIFSRLPLSYGSYYMILNFIMLVIVFFLDKHYINIATVLNMFFVGYIVDFTVDLFKRFDVIANATVVTRVILLLSGIVLMCFSASLYYTADLGVSTYDAFPLVMADKKVAKFQYCRVGCDFVCVTIGFLCLYFSGTKVTSLIGVGTIITAFFMGPLIEVFNVHIARPLLNK
ncbi:putative membrane spanning protein [Lachnospiraceae bacterium TWA4]|nr:putative membrane spanning protein [Lachnospiraceae bacterium TWA4]